jgi:hypothetical protein
MMATAARMAAAEGLFAMGASFVNRYKAILLRIPRRMRRIAVIVPILHAHLIPRRDAGHILNEAAFDVDFDGAFLCGTSRNQEMLTHQSLYLISDGTGIVIAGVKGILEFFDYVRPERALGDDGQVALDGF